MPHNTRMELLTWHSIKETSPDPVSKTESLGPGSKDAVQSRPSYCEITSALNSIVLITNTLRGLNRLCASRPTFAYAPSKVPEWYGCEHALVFCNDISRFPNCYHSIITTVPSIMVGDLILITGATGHVGFGTLAVLLEHGYRARIVHHQPDQVDKLKRTPTLQKYLNRVEFALVPDLQEANAFKEAIKGVSGVIHVAAPIPLKLDGDLSRATQLSLSIITDWN